MQCAGRAPAAPSARAHHPSTAPLPAPLHGHRGRSLARDVAPCAATSPGVSGDRSADSGAPATAASTLVLGTAINIASAAVEAYVTPTEGQEFRCCGSNGTTTQFIGSGGFIAKQLNSILKVNIGDVSVSAKTDVLIHLPPPPPTAAALRHLGWPTAFLTIQLQLHEREIYAQG